MKYQYVEVSYFDGEGVIFGIRCQPISVRQLLEMCGIDYTNSTIGKQQKVVGLDYIVADGDQIALYPPLRVDPKQKRRRLVESKKQHRKRME